MIVKKTSNDETPRLAADHEIVKPHHCKVGMVGCVGSLLLSVGNVGAVAVTSQLEVDAAPKSMLILLCRLIWLLFALPIGSSDVLCLHISNEYHSESLSSSGTAV